MGNFNPNVENLRALGDITQAHRWGVSFVSFPQVCTGFTSEDINFRAESVTLPKLNTPPQDLKIRGINIKPAGQGEYEHEITLTCVETVDNKITRFIKQWREGTWSQDDGGGGATRPETELFATILLALLNNQWEPRYYYKLFYCKISAGEPGADLGAEAEPMKPALTISYDYFTEWSA